MAFFLTYAVLSYLKLIAVQYFKISSHGANLKSFGCLNHTWKPSSAVYLYTREQLNMLKRLVNELYNYKNLILNYKISEM